MGNMLGGYQNWEETEGHVRPRTPSATTKAQTGAPQSAGNALQLQPQRIKRSRQVMQRDFCGRGTLTCLHCAGQCSAHYATKASARLDDSSVHRLLSD
jgi:hypothetical protein